MRMISSDVYVSAPLYLVGVALYSLETDPDINLRFLQSSGNCPSAYECTGSAALAVLTFNQKRRLEA